MLLHMQVVGWYESRCIGDLVAHEQRFTDTTAARLDATRAHTHEHEAGDEARSNHRSEQTCEDPDEQVVGTASRSKADHEHNNGVDHTSGYDARTALRC